MNNQEKAYDTWLLQQSDVSNESAQDIALAAFLAGWAVGQAAERERCARIADEQAEDPDGYDYAAENIAKRIRAGGA